MFKPGKTMCTEVKKKKKAQNKPDMAQFGDLAKSVHNLRLSI